MVTSIVYQEGRKVPEFAFWICGSDNTWVDNASFFVGNCKWHWNLSGLSSRDNTIRNVFQKYRFVLIQDCQSFNKPIFYANLVFKANI